MGLFSSDAPSPVRQEPHPASAPYAEEAELFYDNGEPYYPGQPHAMSPTNGNGTSYSDPFANSTSAPGAEPDQSLENYASMESALPSTRGSSPQPSTSPVDPTKQKDRPERPKKPARMATSDAEREIKNLQKNLQAAHAHLESVTKREEEARIQIVQLEEELVNVRKDLRESRSFVEADDSGDSGAVIKQVESLNSLIDDLVFSMFETNTNQGNHDFEGPILPEAVNGFAAAGISDAFERLAVAHAKSGGTVEDYLGDAFKTVIFKSLHVSVYNPFKIGQSKVEEGILAKMYQSVKSSVPQDRSGRWRSITHSSISFVDEKNFAASLASDIMGHLNNMARAAVPDTSVSFDHWIPELTKRVQDAITWRSRTQQAFLSHDYEIYRRLESDTKADEIVGCRALGLIQSRGVMGPNGKVEREGAVLLTSDLIYLSDFK
ncbi:hypothetical protein MNV49_006849 [Pseudohyphozyma bogoriensis]|nr:hypothetical protein MNV49_006849 [Pseudohyphozyma bogoriensis]